MSGSARAHAADSRPLSPRALENLRAFTRLLGLVQYFHPSDEAAATDWDEVAVRGAADVEEADSPEALAARLRQIFLPVAPTLRVETHLLPDSVEHSILAPPGSLPIGELSWRHLGLGSASPSAGFESRREQRPLDSPGPGPSVGMAASVDLGGGVFCRVPLSLYVDSKGTLPHRAPQPTPAGYGAMRHEVASVHRPARFAAVAMLWNAAQHFYPYFDDVHTDWRAAGDDAFRRAAQDSDECAFLETLRRMTAQLHDGHAFVSHPCDSIAFVAPIRWEWVGDELVVRGTAAQIENGPRAGDVVLTIDGEPVARRFEEVAATISSATPQWARHWSRHLMSRSRASIPVQLEFADSAGVRRSASIARIRERDFPFEPLPDSVSEVQPGILYVDLGRIDDAAFEAALPRLVSARGVVFDVRRYPRHISKILLAHLTDRPALSPLWLIPIIRYPDRIRVEWDSTQWSVNPEAPRIATPVAFILDGRAISYAETLLGIVEHDHLGILVGGPSAGTNGNVASFTLPGGYQARFSGMRVLKQDGSPHHGIGIRPTVPVAPTRSDLARGRDRLLEEAIAAVRRAGSDN